jgi:hypothetical protein
MVAHMMLAQKWPRMAMTETEAMQLSSAIVGYLKHTKLRASAKTTDMLVMLQALVLIEGTRVLAELRAQSAERAAASTQYRASPTPRVVPMTPEAASAHGLNSV